MLMMILLPEGLNILISFDDTLIYFHEFRIDSV